MKVVPIPKLSRSTYRASEFTGGPTSTKHWHAADVWDERRPRDETFPISVWNAGPKYPPPPRSGNAFAAALFVAIPGLLLLLAILWVLDGIGHMLAA
jgi:hypothetical protein